MDITVISKARYEQLVNEIKNLENQVTAANNQLKAIQESNNQLADIAFDEAKFTDVLMNKVDEAAREAARDSIDEDQIARDAAEYVDVENEVERIAKQMSFVTEDGLADALESLLEEKGFQDENDVENAIENYVHYNCDFVEANAIEDFVTKDEVEEHLEERLEEHLEEHLEERLSQLKEEIAKLVQEEVKKTLVAFAHQMMHAAVGTHNLFIKENNDANNERDTSIQISGTNGHGQAGSDATANAV